MLCGRREFKVADETIRTPLVIPSYSSRAGGRSVADIINVTREFVRGTILVSAFDIKRHKVRQKALSNAQYIFLDSGGYEAGADADLSEVTAIDGTQPWSLKEYREVLNDWKFSQPTVIVNFDTPNKREKLDSQIARAHRFRLRFGEAAHVFLAKPEPGGRVENRYYLDVNGLIERLDDLAGFDIIGVTEKELGDSLLMRLTNVARLRKALTTRNSQVPIHVFGSLDPVACPLFFLAGADIFDGLTWLRYGFHENLTIYRQNVHALDDLSAETRDGDLSAHIHVKNYHALGRMTDEMIRFTQSHKFSEFRNWGQYFKRVSERVTADLEGK